MKRNILMIMLMVIGVFTTSAKKLNEADFEPTHNVIKVNYGPGLVYSEMRELNTVYKTSSSYDLSVDYCHTFNKGFGFGVNVIQSYLNAIGSNDFYAGASVYYAKEFKNGWYFDASLGLGYAGNDYSTPEGGIGVFEQIGAHYKFTRHFGVGAELRSLSCSYSTQIERPGHYSFEGSFGTNRIALTIGLQYYF